MRKYNKNNGRFLTIDPLWEKYPFWNPYQYCMNNPVSFVDGNGEEAIAIVDHDSKKLTIYAVYVVDYTYSEKEVQNMGAQVNDKLNSLGYSVTEGEYSGFAVQYNLTFISNTNDNVFIAGDGSSFGDIGNSFRRADNQGVGEVLDADAEKGSKIGGVTSNHNDITMNINYGTLRNIIHEIFHTLCFDNDNAPNGIGSYTKKDMVNQEDTNTLINNPDLLKVSP